MRLRWRSRAVFSSTFIFLVPTAASLDAPVQESRENLGRQLAREAPVEADIVVPVPDSGVTAAMGYAAESGIPLRFGLIRNHYVGRTFIEPRQTVRDFGVKLKLNPVRSLLEGKRVVLIDDSIVRGTTSKQNRPHDSAGGRERSAYAHLVSANDFALFLRSGHAFEKRTHCGEQID